MIENISQSLYSARERKMQEQSQLSEIEKLKTVNVKLYTLVKKMIQAEKQNLELKNQIASTEEVRKETRMEYQKITTALGLEDRMKKRIKDFEASYLVTKKSVDELRAKLASIRNSTKDTIDSIENSTVKDFMKKINEQRVVRTYYSEEIKKLNEENESMQEDIEITKKNPKKIPPAVANQNLRSEVKALEMQITERSKEIKEKEREKFQANYNYQEAIKTLNILKAKAELVFPKSKPQTPSVANEKSVAAPSIANSVHVQKKIEAKRDSVLQIIGKGTEGMTKDVMKVLKTVGKPGQGVASKVLELNRSQFNQGKPVTSK